MTFPESTLPDLILFLDYLVTRHIAAYNSQSSFERQGRSVTDELARLYKESTYWKGQRKFMKDLDRDGHPSSRETNAAPPKYK